MSYALATYELLISSDSDVTMHNTSKQQADKLCKRHDGDDDKRHDDPDDDAYPERPPQLFRRLLHHTHLTGTCPM